MSAGDIKVFGLVMGTHIIEDLGMDVPYNVTVTIPADKAARSKDLNRAISQKCVVVLPSAAPPIAPTAPSFAPQPAPQVSFDPVLQERIRALESENQGLRDALQAALQQQAKTESKLDDILAAIKAGGGVVQTVYVGANGQAVKPPGEVADGEAPAFIPAEIRPREAEARIEVQKDEATGASISDARERLRKLRQGGQ